jgi:hypothetical protein
MPLSDDEQRVLDEIEFTLSLDSPRLASSLRTARPRSPLAGQVAVDLSLVLTGLIVLLIGVHANNGIGVALGVIGYAFVVGSVHAMISMLRRRAARQPPHGPLWD